MLILPGETNIKETFTPMCITIFMFLHTDRNSFDQTQTLDFHQTTKSVKQQ